VSFLNLYWYPEPFDVANKQVECNENAVRAIASISWICWKAWTSWNCLTVQQRHMSGKFLRLILACRLSRLCVLNACYGTCRVCCACTPVKRSFRQKDNFQERFFFVFTALCAFSEIWKPKKKKKRSRLYLARSLQVHRHLSWVTSVRRCICPALLEMNVKCAVILLWN
jgi:hypothetical protein